MVRPRFHGVYLIGIALLFFFGSHPIGAQADDSEGDAGNTAGLTAPAVVSAVFPLTGSLLGFVPLVAPQTASIVPWISNPLLLGTHIPLYWVKPSRALGYSIAGVALPAAGISLMFASSTLPIARPLSSTFLGTYSRLMEFSAYDTYRLSKDRRTGHDLVSLAAAPFTWDNIRSPLVWIPSIVAPAALVSFYLAVQPDLGTPVYESGRSYIGGSPVSPLLGGLSTAGFGAIDMLATAIGEESYYRGVLYEEAKRSLGTWPARALDMVFFPALHLPSDIESGLKTETILFNFGWRSAMTMVFDIAKDKGGLPLAVAVHFWSDLVLVLARWVFYGG